MNQHHSSFHISKILSLFCTVTSTELYWTAELIIDQSGIGWCISGGHYFEQMLSTYVHMYSHIPIHPQTFEVNGTQILVINTAKEMRHP